MGIFNKILNDKTIELIKSNFHFLIQDYEYELIRAEKVAGFLGDYFFIFRNNHSKIQIEICVDQNTFHCLFRRIINGKPADFNDQSNYINFEDLAILDSNHKYDHFDFYIGGKVKLKQVLENTANLFKRNSIYLKTDDWFDHKKIEQLKNQKNEAQFNETPNISRSFIFNEIKINSIKLLTENGYELILDNDSLSPFDINASTKKLIFVNKTSKIEIVQVDWRDDLSEYQLIKNNNVIVAIDFNKTELTTFLKRLTYYITENL